MTRSLLKVSAREPLSQWIERNIQLPAGLCADPGPMVLYPYQVGIANALSDPEIERVTVLKAARVGYTALVAAYIANLIANDASAVIVLQPTEADARDFIVSDLEPLLDASGLNTLVQITGSRTERSTIMHRRFAGGSLKALAARSPRNLRRHTARVLLMDEVDGFEVTAEGNAMALAEKRTMTFADRKLVAGSTPANEETSNILRLWSQSDQRIYEVPCPECGAYTEILWSHIEWQEGRPETAAFRCPHNGCLVPERHKPAMVAGGRWTALETAVRGHAGFRINSLVSPLPNATWPKLVEEFLRARHDTDELRVFVNTVLGQAWRDQGEEVDEHLLASRGEPFSLDEIPAEVLVMTAGVDVQDDRLEASVVGWTRAGDACVLDHIVVWGGPEDEATWSELDTLLRTRWRHPLGGAIGIDGCVVDSGAWTSQVYSFCFPRLNRRIWAGKGVAGHHPVFSPSRGKVKGGRLFLVGVDQVKTTILTRLLRGHTVRFAGHLGEEYYAQLASERRVVRFSRGQPTMRFERKPGARAEALDCLCYAFAARSGVQVPLDQREDDLRGAATRGPLPASIPSAWMQRA